MKNRKLLAGPYLFWSVSFIIIPLLMIFYYGLTDKEGTFTWSNIAMMASPEKPESTWTCTVAFPGQHTDLPGSCISSCNDFI